MRRRFHRAACQQSGFTLLELLLAMSLTAMLLGMLSAGVYALVRDWDDNAESLDLSLDRTTAILQIERALQGAFPHSYRDPDSLGRFIYFMGEADRLGWVSTVSPQRNAGLMAWQLESVPREGVQLKLVPAFTDNPEDRFETAEAVMILPGYEAEFRYLFEEPDFTRVWLDEWSGEEQLRLPIAVHVQLIPLAEDETELEIVAPIRASEHRTIRPANTLFSPQLTQ